MTRQTPSNGRRARVPKKVNSAIDTFVSRVLHADGADIRQTAWHEAGHRLMWRVMFPEVATHYAIQCGLPCVLRDDGEHSIAIADMTIEDATRYAYIKLGGIAAEMVLLGLDGDAERIADWVATDYLAGDKARIDWSDDEAHGGDIPEAARIIIEKTGAASLKANLVRILPSCVANINNNREDFDRECAEAESYFNATYNNGLWSLE